MASHLLDDGIRSRSRRSFRRPDDIDTPAFPRSAQYGLLVVFANVLGGSDRSAVPAIPTLVVAGAIAADGGLPPCRLFVWSVLACLSCGLRVGMLVGQVYGIRVLKLLCRISLEPDSCVSQTQTRFESWGINSLVIAKFIPGLAIIAPPLAGAMRIGWPRFVALTSASGMLWVGFALPPACSSETQIEGIPRTTSTSSARTQVSSSAPRSSFTSLQVVGDGHASYRSLAHGAHQRRRALRPHASRRQAPHRRCPLIHRAQSGSALDTRRAAYPLDAMAIISRICRVTGTSSCIAPVQAKPPRPALPGCS